MADLLLMRAKACGLRLARALRAASLSAGEAGPGLRRAADELSLSCAYTRERSLRRHRECQPFEGVAEVGGLGLEDARPLFRGLPWLSLLLGARLSETAAGLGLTERQAAVWAAHVRGETLDAISGTLGVSIGTVYVHLRRAQEKVRGSWLAAYLEAIRRGARG